MSSGEYLFVIVVLLIFIIIWSWGLKCGKGGEEHGEKGS
jgi:hypothetical protein